MPFDLAQQTCVCHLGMVARRIRKISLGKTIASKGSQAARGTIIYYKTRSTSKRTPRESQLNCSSTLDLYGFSFHANNKVSCQAVIKATEISQSALFSIRDASANWTILWIREMPRIHYPRYCLCFSYCCSSQVLAVVQHSIALIEASMVSLSLWLFVPAVRLGTRCMCSSARDQRGQAIS